MMTTIYTHHGDGDQRIHVGSGASLDVVPSGCEMRPVSVDLPYGVDPTAALGLVHAILTATGMAEDYEIALKADSECGSSEELAAGLALVAEAPPYTC
jgi:hypothetical protein